MKKFFVFVISVIAIILCSCESKSNIRVKECVPIIGHQVQHSFLRESARKVNMDGINQIIPEKYEYTYTLQNSYFYILKYKGKYGIIEIIDEELFSIISICGIGSWEIEKNFSVYDYIAANQEELIEKMCWYDGTIRCIRNGYYKIEGKNKK